MAQGDHSDFIYIQNSLTMDADIVTKETPPLCISQQTWAEYFWSQHPTVKEALNRWLPTRQQVEIVPVNEEVESSVLRAAHAASKRAQRKEFVRVYSDVLSPVLLKKYRNGLPKTGAFSYPVWWNFYCDSLYKELTAASSRKKHVNFKPQTEQSPFVPSAAKPRLLYPQNQNKVTYVFGRNNAIPLPDLWKMSLPQR